MTIQSPRPKRGRLASGLGVVCLSALTHAPTSLASQDVAELERRVSELSRELAEAQRALNTARTATGSTVDTTANESHQSPPTSTSPTPDSESVVVEIESTDVPDDSFRIGPVTIGGALRANGVLGSYHGYDDGPNRGGNGGNMELDTFRINLSLDYENIIGRLEYRWYPAGSGESYNFLHTAWLGYRFEDDSEVQAGVNRVPFGPGPYGVSQSWFFDQHYYVGLSDDLDFGLKYSTKRGPWSLDFAYYPSSEGSYFGRSLDSTRYSYDAVRWENAVDANGNVVSGAHNGYDERHQFNLRAIYSLTDSRVPTDLGVSLQYGHLKGERAKDGSHWAASAHMVNSFDNVTLATQLTRYEYDIDANNPWGTDTLIPMGAYDFAWPVAAKAWIPAVSLSYLKETTSLPWLDSVRPYVEYSRIIKDESAFNDSELWVIGAAWASGGWYIYSDLAYSNGNYFVGNEARDNGVDDYGRIDGVGDFGVNGNNKWNYRLNLNLGYYF
ncbi:hypothetical protein [Allochromatium palmeri]|uniref:Carbohydrate porin n=1 Tax=Allochromatium palmeri TaxID=231048 RepID=A0A6N8EBX0_9GAMM|nr:hypothetical protein [Allochromatium palmeri]MTW21712.1 hypothetical protein [Allochromatium palmeri]